MWIVYLVLGFAVGMGLTIFMLSVGGGNGDKEE
jgi:hypothetical protein